MVTRPLRILHVPQSVGSRGPVLSLAEQRLGLDSNAVIFGYHPWRRGEHGEPLISDEDGFIRQEFKKWQLVARTLFRYDVIHYNFGSSILDPFAPRTIRGSKRRYPKIMNDAHDIYRKITSMKDLPIMKRAGKVIFVTYQGNDVPRADSIRANIAHAISMDSEESKFEQAMNEWRRDRLAYFAKYADRIYAVTPDLLHMMPSTAQLLPDTPVDLEQWKPCNSKQDDNRPLKIIHAPTSRGWKGTKYVIEAVERLKGDGVELDFQLVENIPHSKVKQIYQKADLLVDQLVVGWHGGLAVEFMALGKPVVVYIQKKNLQFVPQSMEEELPVINANPRTIYHVLKKCLNMNRSELRAIGVRSRRYVEHWHNPLKIASQLKDEAGQILGERRNYNRRGPSEL